MGLSLASSREWGYAGALFVVSLTLLGSHLKTGVLAYSGELVVAGYVRVVEFHSGLSHSNYYFVVDGGRLTHVSRYAVSYKRVDDMVECCYQLWGNM